MSASRPTEQPAPTGVSMTDLLASCAAAAAISRPPRPEVSRPEGARGTARPATTTQETAGGGSQPRPLRRSA